MIDYIKDELSVMSHNDVSTFNSYFNGYIPNKIRYSDNEMHFNYLYLTWYE